MKKNVFNIMFLSSALLLAVCSCEDPQESVSGNGEINADKVQVTLKQKIYVQEKDANGAVLPTKLQVKEVAVWSEAFQEFKPQPNYEIAMPETCPNGTAYAQVSVGGRYVKNVEIKYYDSIDKAVADNPVTYPEDISKYYNERDYIDNKGKLTFVTYMLDGKLLVGEKESSVDKINAATANPQYNANYINVWNETGAIAATLDPTYKTIPHYTETIVPGETEETTPAPAAEETVTPVTTTYPHTTYLPPENEYSENLMYEIITEADGSIAYFAPIVHSSKEPILASATDKYWSKYKNYQENPCFIFAGDYDVETNPTAFEKVLPEGGQWIVAGHNDPKSVGKIDVIMRELTGKDSTGIKAEVPNFKITWGDGGAEATKIEAQLMEAKVKCVKSANGRYDVVSAFKAGNPKYSYSYYLLQARKLSDPVKTELLTSSQEVLKSIVYLELDEVKNEPVLFEYYTQAGNEKVAEWIASFPTE